MYRRALAFALGVMLACATGSLATDFSGWSNKINITFPGYTQSETLTNFPALIVFSNGLAGTFQYSQFASTSGGDLRFSASDGTTELNYEVESWNTNGTSYVWVQVPALISNGCIWAYWGNANATTAPAYTTSGATWSNGFALVYHMNQTSGSTVYDSTANHNNGGFKNTCNWTNNGAADGCLQFPNSGDNGITGGSLPSGGNWTLSAWFMNLLPTSAERALYLDQNGNDINIGSGSSVVECFGGYNQHVSSPNVTITPASSSNQWQQLTAVGTGGNTLLYLNGVYGGTCANEGSGNTVSINVSTENGGWSWDRQFAQNLDEFRIESVVRSTNWIFATYLNIASNSVFNSYGNAQGGATAPSINNDGGASNVTATTAILDGNLSSASGAVTTVYVYWGLSDAGTTKANWGNVANLGTNSAGGIVTDSVSGLSPNTKYYYRFYATNSAGDCWAPTTTNFTTSAQAPIINNGSGASSVSATTACLNGNLISTGGAATTVIVYWGIADGGTNSANWANTINDGVMAQGAVSNQLTGLSPNTIYYYTYYAANSVGSTWASASTNFTTSAQPPSISNGGASNVTSSSVMLNGNLTSNGGALTTVYLYYGAADAGTTKGNWDQGICLGTENTGSLSEQVTGLLGMTTYYYRFYATNAGGDCWALSTANFSTLFTTNQFPSKMKITFSGYNTPNLGPVLTNFPALITLNPNTDRGFTYATFASSNGWDLRFSDSTGTTELNYQVQQWATNGTSYVWVQVPTLASASDCIWAYWGNASFAGGPPAYSSNGATWDTNYVAVWHLNEQNASSPAIDSSQFGNNAATNGGSPAPVPGIITGGRAFTGNVKLDAPGVNISNKAFTIETWINISNSWSSSSADDMWAGGGVPVFNDCALHCGGRYPNLYFGLYGDDRRGAPNRSGDVNSWHFYTFVMDNSHVKTIYRDGVLEPLDGTGYDNSFYLSSGYSLGAYTDIPEFKGLMDETRVSAGVARSSNWIWACYMTVASNSTFITKYCVLPYAIVPVPGADGGGVSADFSIGTKDVTVGDYVTYLNSRFAASNLSVVAGQVSLASTSNLLCITTAANTNSYISFTSNTFTSVSGKISHPMIYVSWFGAADYCNWKSQQNNLVPVYTSGWQSIVTNSGYRLPMEAEWYKAAAWDKTLGVFHVYGIWQDTICGSEANYLNSGNSFETNPVATCPVGSYNEVSPYFLYDASGNVWEWCNDGDSSPAVDPHPARGGSWGNLATDVKTTSRCEFKPGMVLNSVGFRIAISGNVRQ
jgi:formylglycine-generating enzyme required for sulfatase activity